MPSYVRYNNKKELMDEWVENTLTQEEQNQFFSSRDENSQLWMQYFNSGLISIEPIEEYIFIEELNDYVYVQIGEKIILAEGVTPAQLLVTQSWSNWITRYTQEVGEELVIFET